MFNFKAIVSRLAFAYADKRLIYIIEQELSTLRQGNKSVIQFYDETEQKLTLLANKVTMTYNTEVVQVINEKYRADALRVFISGLKKPLCQIIFSSRPNNLQAAKALAQKVESNHERYVFATAFTNKTYSQDKSKFSKCYNREENIRREPKFHRNYQDKTQNGFP